MEKVLRSASERSRRDLEKKVSGAAKNKITGRLVTGISERVEHSISSREHSNRIVCAQGRRGGEGEGEVMERRL